MSRLMWKVQKGDKPWKRSTQFNLDRGKGSIVFSCRLCTLLRPYSLLSVTVGPNSLGPFPPVKRAHKKDAFVKVELTGSGPNRPAANIQGNGRG